MILVIFIGIAFLIGICFLMSDLKANSITKIKILNYFASILFLVVLSMFVRRIGK